MEIGNYFFNDYSKEHINIAKKKKLKNIKI
jgi:hypothetical protein